MRLLFPFFTLSPSLPASTKSWTHHGHVMTMVRIALSHRIIVEELSLYFYGNIYSFKQLFGACFCVGFSGHKDGEATGADNLLHADHSLVCKEGT